MKFRLLIFLCFILNFASAQESGFQIYADKKVTIPFQLINNLVFIDLEVNGVTLTFLVDTGVSKTLLFSTGEKDIQFRNSEKTKFSGLGGNIEVEGLKSRNNMVRINDDYRDYQHTIYVILDEEFNFSSYIGIPVHGIIGYDFFKNYPVQIDYNAKKITLYKNEKYYQRKTRKFTEIPITIEGNKPYIMGEIDFSKEKRSSKLLIDTGNSDPLWILPEGFREYLLNRPHIKDFLGRGFNGEIYGIRGRVHQLHLGDFKFEKPIVAMPDEKSIAHLEMTKDRKGSIGGDIMRRFTAVFDYKNKKILLKKNRNFDDFFRLNMSGLEFKHIGMKYEEETVKVTQPFLQNEVDANKTTGFILYKYKLVLKPVYAIVNVRVNSPAANAGLKNNDVLKKINGRSTSNLALTVINEMMRAEEGKIYKFEVLRNEMPLQFTFTLTDPIPYQE